MTTYIRKINIRWVAATPSPNPGYQPATEIFRSK